MFTYCPACASKKIRFEEEKVFHCPDCGFTYYHNTAAATACVVRSNAGILFFVRAREPAKGLLDLPGGFVDPGEGAIDGLRRELIEELGFDPLISTKEEVCAKPDPLVATVSSLTLFASFSNVYRYKNIPYNTCDLFFCIDLPDICERVLRLDEAEVSAVRFIKPEDLDLESLAFESAKKAIKRYLELYSC